jgi:SAM-dependent methyltransferase
VTTASTNGVRRLNWGCGTKPEPGWINSDRRHGPGIDLSCDIREGLPLESDSIDYAVSIHALQELTYSELVPALEELLRVLKPGGVLRLVLPDAELGIRAYTKGEADYFLIPDKDAGSLGGKFCVQLTWYGHSRSLFTSDFIDELLARAGFEKRVQCEFQQTASPFPEITSQDNREGESLFVEAFK